MYSIYDLNNIEMVRQLLSEYFVFLKIGFQKQLQRQDHEYFKFAFQT